MTNRHHGWDLFSADPGKEPPRTTCRVCAEPLIVKRVDGARTFIQAMSGSTEPHDSYFCRYSGFGWHKQALALLQAAEETPSLLTTEMFKEEARQIVALRQPDLPRYRNDDPETSGAEP